MDHCGFIVGHLILYSTLCNKKCIYKLFMIYNVLSQFGICCNLRHFGIRSFLQKSCQYEIFYIFYVWLGCLRCLCSDHPHLSASYGWFSGVFTSNRCLTLTYKFSTSVCINHELHPSAEHQNTVRHCDLAPHSIGLF